MHFDEINTFFRTFLVLNFYLLTITDKTAKEVTSLVAAGVVIYKDEMYVFGGLGSNVDGNLRRLTLPEDVCT